MGTNSKNLLLEPISINFFCPKKKAQKNLDILIVSPILLTSDFSQKAKNGEKNQKAKNKGTFSTVKIS